MVVRLINSRVLMQRGWERWERWERSGMGARRQLRESSGVRRLGFQAPGTSGLEERTSHPRREAGRRSAASGAEGLSEHHDPEYSEQG